MARVTDSSLGVIIFPRGMGFAAPPHQLYEAFEGIVLFGILFALMHIKQVRSRYGVIAGAFFNPVWRVPFRN